ncbi:MAG: hypothetical protein AB8B83_07130 [Bdellovibrionales bacterium]
MKDLPDPELSGSSTHDGLSTKFEKPSGPPKTFPYTMASLPPHKGYYICPDTGTHFSGGMEIPNPGG